MTEYYKNDSVTLYCGDCLEVMPELDITFDACITDPPYGVLNRNNKSVKWDSVINFDAMWNALSYKTKNNAPIVLFGTEPFSSSLRMSNPAAYRYDWIWNKTRVSGFLNAKKQPLRCHEIISVFCYGKCPYYPQMRKCEIHERNHSRGNVTKITNNCYGKFGIPEQVITDEKYPKSIIDIPKGNTFTLHPTQKPVTLMEYLINTYTKENDTVLDFCAGSGTTGVACMNTGRKCVLIEKEEKYCEIITKRLEDKEKEITERLL